MGLINSPLQDWINQSVTTLTSNGETLMEYFLIQPDHPLIASILFPLANLSVIIPMFTGVMHNVNPLLSSSPEFLRGFVVVHLLQIVLE